MKNRMVQEKKLSQMDLVMKVNMKMVINMVKVNFFGPMEHVMKAISSKMILTVMVHTDGETVEFFKETGDQIRWTEWEYLFGLIKRNI